jgi:hypothetical protein
MRYTPRTEQEEAAAMLIPAGTYEGVVQNATEKKSKNGNDMIELMVTLYTSEGEHNVFDYLVSSEAPLSTRKIRHFCRSAGLNYEAGELTDVMCMAKNVRCVVGVQKNPGYPPKNVIDDYEPRNGKVDPGNHAASIQDDDIPF